MARIVQKFGGTSVGDVDRIRRVARRVKAAVDAGDDLLTQLPAVEGVLSVFGDAPERLGQVWIVAPITGVGRVAIDQEGGRGPRVEAQCVCCGSPLLRDDRRDPKTFVGDADRRAQEVGERRRPVPVDECAPSR